MASLIKSALPLTLAISPLLVAAAHPPTLETTGVCNTWDSASENAQPGSAQSAQAVTEQPIARPISTDSTHAIVNTEEEMSLFSNRRLVSAVRRLLNRQSATAQASASTAASQGEAFRQCGALGEAEFEMAVAPVPVYLAQATEGGQPPLPVLDDFPASTTPDVIAPEATMPAAPIPVTPAVLPKPAPVLTPIKPSAGVTQASTGSDPSNFTPTVAAPTPFDGSVPITLATLPDGNYRFLEGDAENRAYTDEELAQRGDAVFLARKEGASVVGTLFSPFGQAGVCVTGQVSGNAVIGASYSAEAAETEAAETVADAVSTSASEGVAPMSQIERVGEAVISEQAVLDLSEFSIINAGTMLPPVSCEVTEAAAAAEPEV